jgi:hypothetical protein
LLDPTPHPPHPPHISHERPIEYLQTYILTYSSVGGQWHNIALHFVAIPTWITDGRREALTRIMSPIAGRGTEEYLITEIISEIATEDLPQT